MIKIKWRWIFIISLRIKDYKWDVSYCVCCVYFNGGYFNRFKNILVIFFRRDLKIGKVEWLIDIFYLLVGKILEED